MLEFLALGVAAFGWAILAVVGDRAAAPRTRAESSPFVETDFGLD